MDTQTTVLTALLTSFVVMASPKEQPKPVDTEVQKALAVIRVSTNKTAERLERATGERPALVNDAVKD